MGVILFIMLSGTYPFNFRNLEEELVSTPVLFLGPTWAKISDEAKHLLTRLLDKEANARITSKQALDHPWV